MSDLNLIPYQPGLKEVWDRVVNQSKNSTFLHLRVYMDYHAQRFDERSVIVQRKGSPVAVFPCNRQGDLIISHAGLTYGGLIYIAKLHAIEVLDIFSLLIHHFKDQGACKLLYKAIPHIFHQYPAEEDLYALFRHKARLVRRDISSAILLKNKIKVSGSRKCTILKAKKSGLEFVKDDNLPVFHQLLKSVLNKFDAQPVHTLPEMELLQHRFPDRIRLFTAYKDATLLAGALVYDFGRVVHTQYLANSDEGRTLGALDFVLWNLIDDIFNDRDYFSFGISTGNQGMHLNEGLIFQKEGFGGRAIVHDFYQLELQ